MRPDLPNVKSSALVSGVTVVAITLTISQVVGNAPLFSRERTTTVWPWRHER